MKTIYLIRHSEPIEKEKLVYLDKIDDYQKNQNRTLSINGIEKIKNITKQHFHNNIDHLYSSPLIRTIETAKFISEENNININILNKFKERKIGENPKENFWIKQLEDENYKLPDGESRKEVKERMLEGLKLVLENMKDNETSVIVSHGASITFLLMNWCKLERAIPEGKIRHLTFNNQTVINDSFNTPEIFKLEFKNHNPEKITRISTCKG